MVQALENNFEPLILHLEEIKKDKMKLTPEEKQELDKLLSDMELDKRKWLNGKSRLKNAAKAYEEEPDFHKIKVLEEEEDCGGGDKTYEDEAKDSHSDKSPAGRWEGLQGDATKLIRERMKERALSYDEAIASLVEDFKPRNAGAGRDQLSAEIQQAMANRSGAVAGEPPRAQVQPPQPTPQAPMPEGIPAQTSQRPMQAIEQEPSGLPLQDEVQTILGAQKQYLNFATQAQKQHLQQEAIKAQYGV